jgi:dihydroorotate dehydrogenase
VSGSLFDSLLRPLLFRLDAEDAHELGLGALELASRMPRVLEATRSRHVVDDPRLRVRAFGVEMPNPLGLAAGFDKDAKAVPALAALGFGHVEVGTITPRAQPGNDRPRVFRLERVRALVNRMGFPGEGAHAAAARLRALVSRPCAVAVNVGRGKTTNNDDAHRDCADAARTVRGLADWLVVNVSSPNTPGLRALQAPEGIARLLAAVRAESAGAPVLVKLAPDLEDAALDDALDAARDAGAGGVVLANTTLSRTGGTSPTLRESGGMSGPPLLPRTEHLVHRAFQRCGHALPIVAVGGVSSGADVLRLVRAGATLVQAYTGFVYGGPAFATRVLRELGSELDRAQASTIEALRGIPA